MKNNDMLVVGFDKSENDRATMLVGRKMKDGKIKVLNEFHDQEAIDLYKKLIGENSDE